MANEHQKLISVTIITLNEASRIGRCIQALNWADEIIVVDSFSTDGTQSIATSMGAKVIEEKWHGYGKQKNIAMGYASGRWVFNVDADEVVTEELKREILQIIESDQSKNGYAVARKTFYMGKWIRHGGWYPNYVVRLCLKDKGKWTEPAVHERLEINGEVGYLENPLEHYTFESIEDQVRTNIRYAKEGAIQQSKQKGPFELWRLFVKPLAKFIECYFLKLGMLDGIQGFVISINAAHSMFLKQAFHLEIDQEAHSVEKSIDSRQSS